MNRMLMLFLLQLIERDRLERKYFVIIYCVRYKEGINKYFKVIN